MEVGDFIRFYKPVRKVNSWRFLTQRVRGDEAVGTSDSTQLGGPRARNDGNDNDNDKSDRRNSCSDRGGHKSRSGGRKVKKFATGHCCMA